MRLNIFLPLLFAPGLSQRGRHDRFSPRQGDPPSGHTPSDPRIQTPSWSNLHSTLCSAGTTEHEKGEEARADREKKTQKHPSASFKIRPPEKAIDTRQRVTKLNSATHAAVGHLLRKRRTTHTRQRPPARRRQKIISPLRRSCA